MKIIKKNGLILLLGLTILSCTKKGGTEGSPIAYSKELEQITIALDSLMPRHLKYSQLFSDYKVIALETKKECLISRIEQLDTYDGHIYVFDRKAGGIFVFNDKGDYIQSIGKKGKGAGEYIRPICIYLNKNEKHLACLDGKLKKVIIYSLDGKLLKEIKLKGSHMYSNIITTKDRIYFDVVLTDARPDSKSLVYAIDYSGNPIWEWCPKREPITDLRLPRDYASLSMVPNNSGFSLIRLYLNSIYKLSNETMDPFILFNSEKMLTQVHLENMKKLKSHQIHSYTVKNKLFNGVNQYMESDDYIYMSFHVNGIYHILINKNSYDYLCFKPRENDLSGIKTISFDAMDNNYMIQIANDRIMQQLIEQDSLNLSGSHEISPVSNPAVILYKLKENLPYNEN